jgi:death-on-curing family protein
LPGSDRRAFALSAAYIEYIHDWLIALAWPGLEPVTADEFRDQGLLESATQRPFQTVGGRAAYRRIEEKAATLFHSLISNHPFANGNKRTAVLALDLFLAANSRYLVLSANEMYALAIATASYRQRGKSHAEALQEILSAVDRGAIPFGEVRTVSVKTYRMALANRRAVRNHPLNLSTP